MKGELLTSIQYLPSSERINVNIMRGRGFYFEDFDKGKHLWISSQRLFVPKCVDSKKGLNINTLR